MAKSKKELRSERVQELLDEMDDQSTRSSDQDFDGDASAASVEKAKILMSELKDAFKTQDDRWSDEARNADPKK